MIDMHCHLDLYSDPIAVTKECGDRGLYVLSVTTTPKAWSGTNRLAKGHDRIKTALGLHPQLAHERGDELDLFDELLPQVKYVGEIGLDGGRGYKCHWEDQLKVFRHILKGVNYSGGRIMTIHSRASASAVLDELDGIDGIPILHWFSGTRAELKRAIAMGCWFSVGPAMVKSKRGRDLVANMPIDRVLTETDGPFAKYENRQLMPWDVTRVFSQLEQIWGYPKNSVVEVIDNNLRKMTARIVA